MEPNENCFFARLKGLPWSATRDDVQKFLKDSKLCEGNTAVLFVVDCATAATGIKKAGEALVAFPSADDLEKALACSRNYIGKRWVDVTPATHAEFVEQLGKMAPKDSEYVVRMRGLPYAATKEDIKEFFGEIEIAQDGILVVTDNQGRCGGEAYVEFTSVESTQAALLKNRNKMGSRFIEVLRSTKGEMAYVATMKATPLMSINTRNHPDKNLSGIKRARLQRDNPGDRGFGNESPEYQIFSKYSFEKFIHLRGLPFGCTENDIVDFFAPIQVISLSMICDDSGKFTGIADAYFETDSDAIRALNENRRRLGRRAIDLSLKNRKVFVLGRLNPIGRDNMESNVRDTYNNYDNYDDYNNSSFKKYPPPLLGKQFPPPLLGPPLDNFPPMNPHLGGGPPLDQFAPLNPPPLNPPLEPPFPGPDPSYNNPPPFNPNIQYNDGPFDNPPFPNDSYNNPNYGGNTSVSYDPAARAPQIPSFSNTGPVRGGSYDSSSYDEEQKFYPSGYGNQGPPRPMGKPQGKGQSKPQGKQFGKGQGKGPGKPPGHQNQGNRDDKQLGNPMGNQLGRPQPAAYPYEAAPLSESYGNERNIPPRPREMDPNLHDKTSPPPNFFSYY